MTAKTSRSERIVTGFAIAILVAGFATGLREPGSKSDVGPAPEPPSDRLRSFNSGLPIGNERLWHPTRIGDD